MAISLSLNINPELQRCIDECLSCHAICENTAGHCLDMGGSHAGKVHQTVLKDCAQMCMTAADFMIRESPMHSAVCGTCTMTCERCEEECRRMGMGDAKMMQCAEACKSCAASCRQMAQMAGKGAYTM